MRRFRSLAVAVLLLAPAAVRAADVPVLYTVDTTALKLAISGTNLTFQLYTDAACTSLTHTQVLTVDNVSLLSVLKRSKPKNGAKPPKTTDIRAVLSGVAPAAPLYAKVTGTGITPVGSACQPQAATAAGASTGGLVMKDSNGAVLGPFDTSTGAITMSDGGTLLLAFATPMGFFQGAGFYYTSTDCSGTPLSTANAGAGGFLPFESGVDGNTLFYGPMTAPLTLLSSASTQPTLPASCVAPGQVFIPPDICCCQSPTCWSPFSAPAGPPSSMDVSGFVPPFTPSLQ